MRAVLEHLLRAGSITLKQAETLDAFGDELRAKVDRGEMTVEESMELLRRKLDAEVWQRKN